MFEISMATKGEFLHASLLSREHGSLLFSKLFVIARLSRKKCIQALKVCRKLVERAQDASEVQYNNVIIHDLHSYFQS